MRERRVQNRLYITLVAILGICVLLVSLYIREDGEGPLHSIQSMARDYFSVPVKFMKVRYDALSSWFSGVVNAGKLKKENEKLREQIIESRRLVLEARELERENRKLRKALEFKERYPYEAVLAEIILIHQELGGKFYTIDKGSKDGIEKGAAVMSADGVFGKVYLTGKNSAVVMPLNHPLSSVSVRVVETEQVGILEGTREAKTMLKLIPKEDATTIGNVVVTSGLGKIYPKGLFVGTILKVSKDPNKLDKTIEVGPAVSFDSVDFVYVLKKAEQPK